MKVKFRAKGIKKCNVLYYKHKFKLHQVGFIIKEKNGS